MKMPVVVRPEALTDLLSARDWYDRQREGLGDHFSTQAAAILEQISTSPELFPMIDQQVRACRLRRFPYVVYYRILTDRIEILALLHGSRDPSTWQSRA